MASWKGWLNLFFGRSALARSRSDWKESAATDCWLLSCRGKHCFFRQIWSCNWNVISAGWRVWIKHVSTWQAWQGACRAGRKKSIEPIDEKNQSSPQMQKSGIGGKFRQQFPMEQDEQKVDDATKWLNYTKSTHVDAPGSLGQVVWSAHLIYAFANLHSGRGTPNDFSLPTLKTKNIFDSMLNVQFETALLPPTPRSRVVAIYDNWSNLLHRAIFAFECQGKAALKCAVWRCGDAFPRFCRATEKPASPTRRQCAFNGCEWLEAVCWIFSFDRM